MTEALETERLSKPVAMGVLTCDMISSSAYGTEEMLTELVPYVGAAAYAIVLPVTFAILFVLIVVTLSYREVVMVYTKAGGSYVVARENFGLYVAQFAAVALLIDYTLTVAVQSAAGTNALSSAFPALASAAYQTFISVAVVLLLLWGNLRGIREAGNTFAFPTYFFIAMMILVVGIGLVKVALGDIHHVKYRPRATTNSGTRAAACSRAGACSTFCARSPTAGRRSRAWRPFRTACRPSGLRKGAMPGGSCR